MEADVYCEFLVIYQWSYV